MTSRNSLDQKCEPPEDFEFHRHTRLVNPPGTSGGHKDQINVMLLKVIWLYE